MAAKLKLNSQSAGSKKCASCLGSTVLSVFLLADNCLRVGVTFSSRLPAVGVKSKAPPLQVHVRTVSVRWGLAFDLHSWWYRDMDEGLL